MILEAAADVTQWGDDPDGLVCFLCGEGLECPALHWSGGSCHIYLHPGCFPQLVERPALDAYVLRRRERWAPL